MIRTDHDDIQNILKKLKNSRLKGKGPVTKKELDNMCRAIDEALQPEWQEEKKRQSFSEIEASKIIINS